MPDPTKAEVVQEDAHPAAEIVRRVADLPDGQATLLGVAKLTRTLVETLNTAVLPLAALNYGVQRAREYFTGAFATDLQEHLHGIPNEMIVAPSSRVAGPVLHGMTFALDEPSIHVMYLNLLASAMDARTSATAHPAFTEIIRQLTPDEALILAAIEREHPGFVLKEQESTERFLGGSTATIAAQFRKFAAGAGVTAEASANDALDNLLRLRILAETRWAEAKLQPEMRFGNEELSVATESGCVLEPTDFGLRFIRCCVSRAPSNGSQG